MCGMSGLVLTPGGVVLVCAALAVGGPPYLVWKGGKKVVQGSVAGGTRLLDFSVSSWNQYRWDKAQARLVELLEEGDEGATRLQDMLTNLTFFLYSDSDQPSDTSDSLWDLTLVMSKEHFHVRQDLCQDMVDGYQALLMQLCMLIKKYVNLKKGKRRLAHRRPVVLPGPLPLETEALHEFRLDQLPPEMLDHVQGFCSSEEIRTVHLARVHGCELLTPAGCVWLVQTLINTTHLL